MTQKDAVFSAVTTVLSNNNISFSSSSTDTSNILTRELRAQVNTILVSQFTNGQIDMSDDARTKLNDLTALKAYVSGLVSNWVRKDPRLNGGTVLATSTSTPTVTSKTLKADPQLQALRKLHQAQLDSTKQLEIQAHIDRRIAELKSSQS